MPKENKKRKDALIEDVTKILYENLGKFAEEKYREFYRQRSEREILLSLQEILNELFGPKHTKKYIEELTKKYKIKLHEKNNH